MSVVLRPAPLVGDNILKLHPYSPGKPIEDVKRELGLERVIKLASNENSLGPSARAMEAMQKAIGRVHLYPDAACYDLRKAVTDRLEVRGDQLIFGNGSDEIIFLLGVTFLTPGDELIQADPSFVRYEASATLNEAACHKVPLVNWTHDLDAMAERINERTRLIYITNPNNPTGTVVTAEQVDRFMRQVPDRAVVVFDEAYAEYVDSQEYPRTLDYVREGRNVVVLRTFSKMYGLAGVRVGYGAARPEIIGYLEQTREPFNVSCMAQAAALAALDDDDHVEWTLRMNHAGKARLYEEFDLLDLPYAPTEANFVWVDVQRDSKAVFQALLRKGVIVRTGDIFGAPTHLRVTIGTPDEMEVFTQALREVLAEHHSKDRA
jgi:histidinol-phosphate aminotransferase